MNSIFILEDHPVMLKGLASWFVGTGRWQVLGIASNLEDAKALLSDTPALPDIILLDIQLKTGQDTNNCGFDLIPWLRERYGKKAPAVTVYTHFDDYVHANAAMGFGVKAYVCKHRSEEELEKALLTVLRGELSIDESVKPGLQKVTEPNKLLTSREAEVLALVVNGLSNKRIAADLGISQRTVENILSCIYFKTGISSRAELQKM